MATAHHPIALARQAMATRFEIVLYGDNAVALRAAGEEAFAEIERIESVLSLYRPTSEIAHLNGRAAREPVCVSPPVFRLLEHAKRLSQETDGAFDITVGPLMRCWGFVGDAGQMPTPEALAEAHASVGMHLVELNRNDFTVRFARQGVMLDLGAIGKGYAIGCAAETLREAGVGSALLHGGTSSVYAIGHPPDADSWKIGIEKPEESRTDFPSAVSQADRVRGALISNRSVPPNSPYENLLALIPLRDEALSVSAVWGKFFQTGSKTFGHVIDPRTGQPADRALLAAVASPLAMETDALSTALLTVGLPGHDQIANLRPGSRSLVVSEISGQMQVATKGITCI